MIRLTLYIFFVLPLMFFSGKTWGQDDGIRFVESEEVLRKRANARKRKLKGNFKKVYKKSSRRKSNSKRRRSRVSSRGQSSMVSRAMILFRDENFAAAANDLYSILPKARRTFDRMNVKYLLGLSLLELGYHQVAAYQFVEVIKNGKTKFVEGSLTNLTVAASYLGDDSLLGYAISRLNEKRVPLGHRDMLHFRKGEYLLRRGKFLPAALLFAKVEPSSPFYHRSKYNQALSFAKAKRVSPALQAIYELEEATSNLEVTDPTRVITELGKARILYQKKDWEASIDAYRSVPRDTPQWHETLFEQSWAFLRSGKFRSALSNFHSLHSPFYERFYIPESLILRAIVYLYICNYQEMTKVIQLFEQVYAPVYNQLKAYLREKPSSLEVLRDFNEFIKFYQDEELSQDSDNYNSPIPELIARDLMKDGELRQLFSYLERLSEEQQKLADSDEAWRISSIGSYSGKLLARRASKTQTKIGKKIKSLLLEKQKGLKGFVEQNSFLRLELVNARKQNLTKSIAKKGEKKQIDENEERDYFVQNGYEYWPFRGEYWLDEIGNYHFVGTRSCE